MRAYEIKVKLGNDARGEFNMNRVTRMHGLTQKSVEALKAVRDRDANMNADVLVKTATKQKVAEKNKNKAIKEWHRDREEHNDLILARIKQNKEVEKAKHKERVY